MTQFLLYISAAAIFALGIVGVVTLAGMILVRFFV